MIRKAANHPSVYRRNTSRKTLAPLNAAKGAGANGSAMKGSTAKKSAIPRAGGNRASAVKNSGIHQLDNSDTGSIEDIRNIHR